jgi:fatty acid-binding protein DegV
LQIKPIITVRDGKVDVLSRVRTSKRARQELVNMIREQAPLDRLTLLHVNNPAGLVWMREQLVDVLPDKVYEINVTPTLGTHVGTDSLGFVTVNQNWRL